MEANYELPLWFPLRKVAEKATIEEMINIGKARLLRLLNFRPDSAGESIKLNLLNGREELIGNLTLRIVAAVSEDRIFTSWLIEREGEAHREYMRKTTALVPTRRSREFLGLLVSLRE